MAGVDLKTVKKLSGWKTLSMLERYAHPESKPSRGDWIFVLSIVGVLIAVTVFPVMFAVWLLSQFRLF